MTKSAERQRMMRQKRRDAGLCVYCGKPNDNPGKAGCTSCLESRREKQNKRYRDLSREDKIVYIQKSRVYNIQRYNNLKESGRCTRCGKLNDTDGIHCSACKELDREYNASVYEWSKPFKRYDEI